jgi:predicted transcriptional regulator
MSFGTSASAIAAQVKAPEAAIAFANWLAEQSAGLLANADAVEALPANAPVNVVVAKL